MLMVVVLVVVDVLPRRLLVLAVALPDLGCGMVAGIVLWGLGVVY